MKIGLLDNEFYSLQSRLLQEGHELVVFIPYLGERLPEESVNVTNQPGRVQQALSLAELYQSKCDSGSTWIDNFIIECHRGVVRNG